jgi:cytochrome d ubiquinol oxidase subunit II
LLNPTGLLGGVTFVALFVTHGAIFLALKTDGQIRVDARRIATRAGVPAAGLAVLLLLVLGLQGGGLASWLTTVLAAGAFVAALWFNLKDREGFAFIGTAVTIAMAVATYFLILFPNVMPSSSNPAWSLTTENASSSHYTLTVMTIVAAIFTPLVLLYQGWTYWVFRKRLTTQHIPDDVVLEHAR